MRRDGCPVRRDGVLGEVGWCSLYKTCDMCNTYMGTLYTCVLCMGSLHQFLFYCAGIVVLTLLVNATTTEYLLKFLGMSEISHAKKLAMAQAVRRIHDAQLRAVNMLKSDPFLADANWDMVEKSTTVKDPYKAKDDKVLLRGGTLQLGVPGP